MSFQHRVAAWLAVRILAEGNAGPLWDLSSSSTVEFIRCETEQPVDDIMIGLLNERWGGEGRVVVHGQTFDARTLPAIVVGEQEGLAAYQIRTANDLTVAELITLDALTSGCGVGTALIEGRRVASKEPRNIILTRYKS
jgi:hypothetical protein